MDCTMIRSDLIAYHFGVRTEAGRQQVEDHLLACQGCLRDYLKLKREVETGAWLGQRPSVATKQALRRDVQAAFRPSLRRRLATVLKRPIPAYQGLLAAAVLLLLAGTVPLVLRGTTTAPPPPPQAVLVDTSRPIAAVRPMY